MPLLDVALACLSRGWFVFPCKPRAKEPLVRGGFHAASNSEEHIREWWSKWPHANVGIATGASGLTVLDIDTGIADEEALGAFRMWNGIPETYTIRTGRRPGFGVQMYFQGGSLKSIPWTQEGISGDVRSASGYVLAEGCYHPSGAFYERLYGAAIALEPAFVTGLRSAVSERVTGDELIREHRNTALTSIAGKLRNAGLSADALEVALLAVNAERCVPPLGESEVRGIAGNASKWDLPDETPVIVGKPVVTAPVAPADWRENYHTFEEMRDVAPPAFLIDGFLLVDSITAIAAPVAQRKSIIALNVAHALCTGEPLFEHFAVTRRPTRVLYLCPEMGLPSFTDRLKKIGLLENVGKNLFCRTMSHKGGKLELAALSPDELSGAVVIIDTAVRYLKGDENSSEHMRAFAEDIFRLKEHADSIVLLHHSSKGAKGSDQLSLENAMRGSGELGAFVTSCWATRLQDPDNPHDSASYLTNVKQRDFESEPFEATSGKDFRMHFVNGDAVLKSNTSGNRDGKDAAAIAFLREHPELTNRKGARALREMGISRGDAWVGLRLNELHPDRKK